MAGLVRDALQDFRRSVEITRDARFQASLRLARRQRASAYVVSLLSLYVIALSLIPNIVKLEINQSQILLACSVILSVFIIFTSLIDGAQNFYHKGELLHQCARKIASINHKLKNVDTERDGAMKQLEDLQIAYQTALDECPVNHDNVDFYFTMIRKPHLFPDNYHWKRVWPLRTLYRIRLFCMLNSWLLPHCLAVVAISIILIRYV